MSPGPDAIRAARAHAKHTQTQAGAVVSYTMRGWQSCELGERKMPASIWELYLLMTGQHPELIVRRRARKRLGPAAVG